MDAEVHRSILQLYNTGIFPMQVVSLIVAIALTCLVSARPGTKASIMMKGYLSFTYAWIVGVYYLLFGQSSFSIGRLINSVLFSLVAVAFAADIFVGRTEFGLPKEKGKRYITFTLVVLALVVYPLLDWALGHPYPEVLMFGVVPCPTIIFSIGLLAAAAPKVDKTVYILLLLPGLGFGISGPILFDFFVDFLLLGVGIYGLVVLVSNWRLIGKPGRK
jgi:hypothetical protein